MILVSDRNKNIFSDELLKMCYSLNVQAEVQLKYISDTPNQKLLGVSAGQVMAKSCIM